MRWNRPFFVLVLLLAGCLGSDRIGNLQSAEKFTLFSIDGRREPGTVKAIETFQGYPVLGQVEITDADVRRKLIAAFQDARARRPQLGAKCFWPRHGIRAVQSGRTIEYVICFECFRFSEFVDGAIVRHDLLSGSAQLTFDKPLTDAGIPITPKK